MDPARKALTQVQAQLGVLASAAEDLENASVAMREKNQDQVREILHRGAGKLTKVTEAWQEATSQSMAPQTLAGAGSMASAPWPPVAGPQRPIGGPWGLAPGGPGAGEATDPRSPTAFTPVPVPAAEPTAAGEREAFEESVRSRLRLLQQPYARLEADGAGMREVEDLIRSCRDAVNRGALREAAISLNAAAERLGLVPAPQEVHPAAQ